MIGLNKFYSFCMTATIRIVIRHGLTFESSHRNQPNRSKLALYKLLLYLYSKLKTAVHNGALHL